MMLEVVQEVLNGLKKEARVLLELKGGMVRRMRGDCRGFSNGIMALGCERD